MKIPLATRSVALAALLTIAAVLPTAATAATPSDVVPGVVVVGYRSQPSAGLVRDVEQLAGARATSAELPSTSVVAVPRGRSMTAEIRQLRGLPGVAYAVPDYVAHAAGGWIPDDRGRGPHATDWRLLQWNFLPGVGVDAPDAWRNMFIDHDPGGRGTIVAILDTGVAYRNWRDPETGVRYAESPDFRGTHFTAPCDLLRDKNVGRVVTVHGQRRVVTQCHYPYALDRNGHGTLVAGIVAETTNNRIGLTGLAYNAAIMPVRVLDANGDGDSLTIARGIRYAVVHRAQIINLSLEFTPTGPGAVTAADIPEIINAINFAHTHGVIVVAAAGNDSLSDQIAYPAADQPDVISVGGTTRDGCLADYSNAGPDLDLVAPGGGSDSPNLTGPNCHPGRYLPDGDIYQMTFADPSHPRQFSIPGGWYGTSMASPEVAATAALVIASGVLGAHPTPDAVLARLEQTAQPLGSGRPNPTYGWGLLDAGTATAGPSLVHPKAG